MSTIKLTAPQENLCQADDSVTGDTVSHEGALQSGVGAEAGKNEQSQ